MKMRTKEEANKYMKSSKEDLVRDLMVAYNLLDAYEEVIKQDLGEYALKNILLKVREIITPEALMLAIPDKEGE